MKATIETKRIVLHKGENGEIIARAYAEVDVEFQYTTKANEEAGKRAGYKPLESNGYARSEQEHYPFYEQDKLREIWDGITKQIDSV